MGAIYRFGADLYLKADCKLASETLGKLPAGTNTSVSEIYNNWYNTQNGWVYGVYGDVSVAEKVSSSTTTIMVGSSVKLTMTTDINGDNIPNAKALFAVRKIDGNNVEIEGDARIYWVTLSHLVLADAKTISVSSEAQKAADKDIRDRQNKMMGYSNDAENKTIADKLNGLKVTNLRGIYGMPYQYMETADTRIGSGEGAFGRKYTEKIVSKMPLLVMVPGTPEFLAGYSAEDKENLLSQMVGTVGGDQMKTDLDTLISGTGKYYGLSVDWTEYFNHVNPMCRAAAAFLNLNNKKYFNGDTIGGYDWSKGSNDQINSILNYRGGSAFYIHSDQQISEAFGNSTGQSALAGKVNGISDMGREMNFLMGGSSAAVGMKFDQLDSKLVTNAENKDSMVNSMMTGNGLIGGIMNGLSTVISGGKLIFPEIWNDSHFSRDYNIHVKLVSPDCDKYSIYLNIIVPLLHLVGFACPRSVGPNGYVSPFLVRAFYKGLFNCDMGIITNMSVSKGQEGSWTMDGLPTAIDVNFTIKELYGTMAITTNHKITNGILTNITLMDYIANMCGVNINEPDLKRTIYMYYSQYLTDKFKDMVYLDAVGGVDQWATNKIMGLFGRR